jgi:hypothetical protein
MVASGLDVCLGKKKSVSYRLENIIYTKTLLAGHKVGTIFFGDLVKINQRPIACTKAPRKARHILDVSLDGLLTCSTWPSDK